MAVKTTTILLVFGEAVACPEVVWSLRDAGFRVAVVFRRGETSPARKLLDVEVHEVTAPERSCEDCVGELARVVEEGGHDAVMPLDDPGVFVVDALSSVPCPVVGSHGDQARLALDKRRQFELVEQAGFDVPAWEAWPGSDRRGGGELGDGEPVIVKPALAGASIDGRFDRGRAFLAPNRAEASARLEEEGIGEPMIIQAVVRGVGEGIFGIAHEGELVSPSGHRRIRMMNPAGSGSSACISRALDPEEIESASLFIERARWDGPFMIETLRPEGRGRSFFMEVNGRPWGSLALARRQGLEYPAWSVASRLSGVRPPDVESRPGVICRHLGREIVHLLLLARGDRSGSPHWPSRWSMVEVLGWRPSHRWYNADRSQRGFLFRDAWATIRSRLGGRSGA